MKVVILARVSTDKQDYNRQITELQEHCEKMGYEVIRVFANRGSGTKKNEDRSEIMEMLAYIEDH